MVTGGIGLLGLLPPLLHNRFRLEYTSPPPPIPLPWVMDHGDPHFKYIRESAAYTLLLTL